MPYCQICKRETTSLHDHSRGRASRNRGRSGPPVVQRPTPAPHQSSGSGAHHQSGGGGAPHQSSGSGAKVSRQDSAHPSRGETVWSQKDDKNRRDIRIHNRGAAYATTNEEYAKACGASFDAAKAAIGARNARKDAGLPTPHPASNMPQMPPALPHPNTPATDHHKFGGGRRYSVSSSGGASTTSSQERRFDNAHSSVRSQQKQHIAIQKARTAEANADKARTEWHQASRQ